MKSSFSAQIQQNGQKSFAEVSKWGFDHKDADNYHFLDGNGGTNKPTDQVTSV